MFNFSGFTSEHRLALALASTLYVANSTLPALAQQQAPAANPQTVQRDSRLANRSSADRCFTPNTPVLRTMKWGYYPGYGCGPIPPAQTVYP